MCTMFGFFPKSSIIFSIIILLTIGIRCTFSTRDSTFDDHQLPHRLTKRQYEEETTCAIPAETPDKVYAVTEFNGNPIENAQPGLRLTKGANIELKCTKGYAFNDGTTSSKSICTSNGKWHPEIKSCLRICDPLQPYNVDLTCKFDEREIDCNKKLLSGTIVTPRCKDLFHPSVSYDVEYTFIRCQDDGRWDNPLFKCIPDCGKPALESLLADGQNSTLGQSPWHVAIFSLPRKADEPLICGGTLITTNVVLTAAHCFYDFNNKIAKKDPVDYEIAVAKITRNRTKIDNAVQKTFQISEIIFYDKPYSPTVTGYVADIALVILKGSITISPEVLPACFRGGARRGFNPGAGVLGLLAGWGLDENNKPSQVLKTIKVPYINHTECVKKVTIVTLDKFCAGTNKGPRPLKGDSGGGLMFKDQRNLYFVRGIVSASDKYTDKSITTFTDISYYQDWIDRILLEKKGVENSGAPSESGSWTTPSAPATTTKNYCQMPLTYRGCYDVSPKSSLLNNRISNNYTTPEACIEFCATWQSSFAGMINQECLCGQHIPSDLVKRSNSECNYPCQGSCHKKLTCGGNSKVSIYETGEKIVQPTTSRSYLGCFKDDNPNARVLNGTYNPFYSDNSPHKCHQHCFNTGFRYFGLTYFHECFCGDTGPASRNLRPESECNNPCTGNSKEVCGGGWRLSVYTTGITDYPEVGRLLGCFKNLPNNEFNVDIKLDIITISNRRCLNFCTFSGYKYSAVLNGNDAFCGCRNTPPAHASLDNNFNCEKKLCPGDQTEMCGDANHVKVYQTRLADPTTPEKVKYAGCYEDHNEIHMIEDYKVPVEDNMSGELCAKACRNKEFAFAGLYGGKECFCGHTYPPPSQRRPDLKCTLPCQESSTEECKDFPRVVVYETGLRHNQARVSRVYLGCFKYGAEEDTPLNGSTQILKSNSPDVCHKLCLKMGYVYFGLTQANKCLCGDEDPTTGKLQSESQCTKECSGDANKRCGSETSLSIYKTGLEDVEIKSLGCYQTDEDSFHEYLVTLPISNTPERCSKICFQLGFLFAATENGNICRCGNEKPGNPPEKDTAKCQSKCSGLLTETCGGNNYMEILYVTSHTPPDTSKCAISQSTKNGKSLCKFEMIFDENFDTLNTSNWKYSVKMASKPDYEFVTYSQTPQAIFVKDGKLNIRPTLWRPDNFTRGGKDSLLTGCTGIPNSEECTRMENSTSILPPVLSAQITTVDSLSFRFGRLEIRAKFPSGDWIVPQIWLTPKESAYGPGYASGQIRIAHMSGNKNLQCDGKEMGSRILHSGVVFGLPNQPAKLMGRNESAEEWSTNFHNYSLVWTEDDLTFYVDGKLLSRYPQNLSDTLMNAAKLPQNLRHIWRNGSKLAPFDKEFYITLGVSVGGFRDFSDSCISNKSKKPWSNASPKAMLDFWKKREEWRKTWSDVGSTLQIDHIKVAAL